MTHKISASSELTYKDLGEINLWAEKPQIEFEDLTTSNRLKEFNKQLQVSTALLLRVEKEMDKYRALNSSTVMQLTRSQGRFIGFIDIGSYPRAMYTDSLKWGCYQGIKNQFLSSLGSLAKNTNALEEQMNQLSDTPTSKSSVVQVSQLNKPGCESLDWIKEKNQAIEKNLSTLEDQYDILHECYTAYTQGYDDL